MKAYRPTKADRRAEAIRDQAGRPVAMDYKGRLWLVVGETDIFGIPAARVRRLRKDGTLAIGLGTSAEVWSGLTIVEGAK